MTIGVDHCPAYRYRQRPRQARGAVLLEGLWIAWLLIVIWGAATYGQELYGSKWVTIVESRSEAWVLALDCDEDAAADVSGLYEHFDNRVPENGPTDVIDPCASGDEGCVTDVDGLSSENPDPTSVPGWFQVRDKQGESTRIYTHPLRGTTHTFSTAYGVTCNEPYFPGTHDGDSKELHLRGMDIAKVATPTIRKLFTE